MMAPEFDDTDDVRSPVPETEPTVPAPRPAPFRLVGSDDAGVCVDGVCTIPPREA